MSVKCNKMYLFYIDLLYENVQLSNSDSFI